MRYILTMDIGTTAVKGVLVDETMHAVAASSCEIETIVEGNHREQDPTTWYKGMTDICAEFTRKGYAANDIVAVVMSGQMQDLIMLDSRGELIGRAILYSDGRAKDEADMIAERIGAATINKITGNVLDGSIPWAKLEWMRVHDKSKYERIAHVVFSSKDYCIYKLTGEYATDVIGASTSGLMDIKKKCWMREWMEELQMDASVLPRLMYADEQVGVIGLAAANQTGLRLGTPVYAGTGDAGATSLASGITKPGEININLGTSGWVATASHDVMDREGVFNLVAIPRDSYINVVPFLNAGDVHRWISGILSIEEDSAGRYEQIDELLTKSEVGSHGLMFLPYIAGERFPVMDADIRGCYVGVSSETGREDMARASLEGVAYSIREGLEQLNIKPTHISLIGGGGRCKAWCQILADALRSDIHVYHNSEYLPATAVASSAMLNLGMISGYDVLVSGLNTEESTSIYKYDSAAADKMDELYKRFKRIYPAVRGI